MERRRNHEVIVKTLALPGKRVIDVGCGDGTLVRLLASHGAHVLGVECSPRQLAKAWAQTPVTDERIIEGIGQLKTGQPGNDFTAESQGGLVGLVGLAEFPLVQ